MSNLTHYDLTSCDDQFKQIWLLFGMVIHGNNLDFSLCDYRLYLLIYGKRTAG